MKKASKILAPALAVGLAFGATSISANTTKTVEPGDTFWGIAQNHDVTVDELMDLNSDLDPYAIPVGAEIELSVEDENGQNEDVVTHVIQPGNTLWGISQVYDGVTVDDLYDLNPDVDPYELTIGSELAVVERDSDSSNEEADVIYHTVQPGNTFSEIASAYDYVSVEDIMEANPNVDPYSLTVGSQIAIPLK